MNFRYKPYEHFLPFPKWKDIPDSKVHGANMGPIWVLSAPDGPHFGPMNLAIRDMSPESFLAGDYGALIFQGNGTVVDSLPSTGGRAQTFTNDPFFLVVQEYIGFYNRIMYQMKLACRFPVIKLKISNRAFDLLGALKRTALGNIVSTPWFSQTEVRPEFELISPWYRTNLTHYIIPGCKIVGFAGVWSCVHDHTCWSW